MRLSARQTRALHAICDAFVPGGEGLPSASERGVPAAILDTLAEQPRESQRRQFRALLSVWDSRLLSALSGGGVRRFSDLDPQRRGRVLLRWCDSRLRRRRAVFQALRKATLHFYYTLPGEDGRADGVWERIGYPGPPVLSKTVTPRRLRTLAIDGDTELDCDVCVVGSGAGGGTAAAVLARAGLDVVVLEQGAYYDDADFDGGEHRGYTRLYLNGGNLSTEDQSVALLAGCCVGGGTTVNYTACIRTPQEIRTEWARAGASAFASEAYSRSLEAVWQRLGVNQDHSVRTGRDCLFLRGLAALGWHVDRMPRNVRGCESGVCGYCAYGCPIGAKQSISRTWLADAQSDGARVAVGTRAQRVIVRRGAACAVEAQSADGRRVSVRCRAVVAACGALQTPALLRRSGLSNANIGRHLRLHPATAVWGVFASEVRPWEGMLVSHYSDEHADLGEGYGVRYDAGALNPSLLVSAAPWRGAAQHAQLMRQISHCLPIMVFLRDRDGGEVAVGRDGNPVFRYRLSGYDRAHLRRGVDGAAAILEAAGARRIYSAHSRLVSYEPGRGGSRAGLQGEADRCGWGAGQCMLASVHPMCSARMGGSPRTSVCDPGGQTWEVRGLYVLDGSSFPSAPGVNPMVSIEAIAHMNASALAAKLS